MRNHQNAILLAYFQNLSDPRQQGKVEHKLIDIVMIAISAVLSGAESWTEIELFGQEKKKWLSSFLELPNGIPSHDTFREVFMRLDPLEFEEHFLMWVRAVAKKIKGLVSIDGKQLRRSHDKNKGKKSYLYGSNNEHYLFRTKLRVKTDISKSNSSHWAFFH